MLVRSENDFFYNHQSSIVIISYHTNNVMAMASEQQKTIPSHLDIALLTLQQKRVPATNKERMQLSA